MNDSTPSAAGLLRRIHALLASRPAGSALRPAEAAMLREAAELLRRVAARERVATRVDRPHLQDRAPRPRDPTT